LGIESKDLTSHHPRNHSKVERIHQTVNPQLVGSALALLSAIRPSGHSPGIHGFTIDAAIFVGGPISGGAFKPVVAFGTTLGRHCSRAVAGQNSGSIW